MRTRSKLRSAEWDMTPMIDVVFLLIVFFTLVINFTAADQDERVKLPVSELAKPPEKPPSEPITLHILSSGHIIYNGIEYPLHELQEKINERLRILKYLYVPTEKVTVIIRGDAQSKSKQIFDVIELCDRLNLHLFDLRTKQPED